MNQPLREPLAQSVCNRLQQAIQDNTWKHRLPGIRALCDTMQVSKQTMMIAIRLLEKSGYVECASPGKARKIIYTHSKTASNSEAPPIIAAMTFAPINELNDVDQNVITNLIKLISSKGYQFKVIVFKELISNSGAQKIKSIVRQNPADLYLVAGSSPLCGKVLKSLQKRIVYLGGAQETSCYPRVGFSFKEICANTIQYITTLGHTRICVMLPENFNRADRSATETEENLKEIFAEKGIPFSTYNCPRWGKTTSDFYETLEKLFSHTPPTVFLLGNPNQMPRLASFLLQKGLRYPDDISIFILEADHSIKEYRPKLSYVEKPALDLAKLTFNEINKLLNDPKKVKTELSMVKTQLVLHDSVKDIK